MELGIYGGASSLPATYRGILLETPAGRMGRGPGQAKEATRTEM